MKMQILALSFAALIAGDHQISLLPLTGHSIAVNLTPDGTDFAFFRVHRQGKAGVTATWDLTSTDGVISFTVQRTYQDPADPYSMWEDLSIIACDHSRSYRYTDEPVLAGTISYRVVATLGDGESIVSPVDRIKIMSK